MAADSLPSPSSNTGPVLGYGTARRRRRWRIVALFALIALVPPAFWWSRSMLQQWSEDRARRAEIRYRVTTNLAVASAEIAEGQWANAQVAIDRARLASQADPLLFSDRESRELGQKIDATDIKLRDAQEQAWRSRDPVIERRIEEAFVRQRTEEVFVRTNVIADLNRTADQLLTQGRYSEALQTLREVLILDPNNAHAQARFPDALLERSLSMDPSGNE